MTEHAMDRMMKYICAVTSLSCILLSSEGCDITLKGTGVAQGGTAVFQYNPVPTTGSVTYRVARGSETAKVQVDYLSGSSTGPAQVNTGITFTGDEASGSIAFTFANVQASDSGVYTLTNSVDDLQCMTLHILGAAPTLDLTTGTSNTNDVSIVADESVIFTCTATSSANPAAPLTYSWTKDGVTLNGETSNSLTISSAATADSGEYKCTATEDITGGLASTSSGISLTVTGGCSIIICFVGPIVTFCLCLIMVILYICTEILKFIGIYSKEFRLKIGLPSAVIFLIGLLLAILLCLLASGCDDDKGWGTGVSVVLVIVCCPCGSVGVIIIHYKFIGDNSTDHGEINCGAGGQTGRGKSGNTDNSCKCFGGNSITPICSGTDNGPQPGPGGRQIPDRGRQRPDGDNGQHQDLGRGRPLPIPAGGDDGLQKSNEGPFRPRKLPDIPPTGDKNVRGISANFDEVVPDKKRLTPIGKETIEINEEESPRKKKKKKKNKESEEYDMN